MNRPIEFRIWSIEEKRFLIDDQERSLPVNSHLSHVITLNGDVLLLDEDREMDICRVRLFLKSSIIISQFTGLLDKNGKKIFEGDILKENDSSIWKVIFKDGSFWFQNAFDESNLNSYDWLKDHGYWGTLEVIGNLFENPELLEGILW